MHKLLLRRPFHRPLGRRFRHRQNAQPPPPPPRRERNPDRDPHGHRRADASGQNYATYLHGGGLIAWLLGPATVALGIPLARHRKAISQDAMAIGAAAFVGAMVSAIVAPLLIHALGGSSLLVLSIAPKSVTTPIAIAIAERTGGVPALAAVFAIIGGVIVAVIAEPILRRFGIQDHRTFGITAGVSGSGIGAAQAVDRHPQAGAYAALAVGLNSILTALLVPVLEALHWL